MKICIDARSPGYAGVLNYTSCLLRNMLEVDKKNKYVILSAPKDPIWNLNGATAEIIPHNNPVGWLIWSNTRLPALFDREKIDVYHSLKHVTAFRGKSKKIITFHSSRFFFYPQHYKWYDAKHWKIMYPAAAKKYDRIIVVSEAEKRNYMKYIDVPEERFRVINLAADSRFKIIKDAGLLDEVKRKYHLPDLFLLFVGRILPVKNIETIIRAYHLAKKHNKFEHKLVIVGQKTWFFKKIASLTKDLGIENDVIFTGPIYDELPHMYNLADLFLFPSFYEAFPAVPLEAMACGTPVIASNVGGLPEVVGDAAFMASPTSVEEFSDTIIQLLSSAQLRETMIEKGLKRAKLFSWDRCVSEHLQVYEEVYS